jgi:hypothetical protein
MLWTTFVLLLLAWMVCVTVLGVTSLFIHLLLVVAAVLFFTRLLGRR